MMESHLYLIECLLMKIFIDRLTFNNRMNMKLPEEVLVNNELMGLIVF